MKNLDDKTSRADVRKELRYTIALLRAAGGHAAELAQMEALLRRWDALDRDATAADDAVDDAEAVVAWRDAALDGAVDEFAIDLDHAVRGDRASLTFTAFFPVAPHQITRQALSAELEATKHFARAAGDVTLDDACAKSLARVEEARARGAEALAARERAEAASSSAAVRVKRFKDEASEARRAVYNALERDAITHKRGADYADLFFRVTRRPKKAPDAKPADASANAAKPADAKAAPKPPAAEPKRSTPSVAPPA